MKTIMVQLNDSQEKDLNVGKQNLIASLGLPKMSNSDYIKYLVAKAKKAE